MYHTGHPLDKFLPGASTGAVATRRIVIVSDHQPVRRPGPRFRLVSAHWAPQHWTVAVYAARRPVEVSSRKLTKEAVMPPPSTILARGRPKLLAAERRLDARAIPPTHPTG